MLDLNERVERELDADRRFFRQHPSRNYAFRKAFSNETMQAMDRYADAPPDGCELFVAVRQVWPGQRVRHFLVAPEFPDLADVGEAAAQIIFGYTTGALSHADVLDCFKALAFKTIGRPQ